MREIKFRGYAKEELTSSQWLTNGFGVDKVKYVDGTSSVFLLTPYGEYVVEESSVGQYTGLKDKNGKEIYEGDIVQTKRASEIKGLVTMYNGCWCICHYYTYYKLFYGFADAQPIEVLGNIYENQELLEE